MGALLVWAERHVGVTSSISSLFYHRKTQKAFKAALWAAGTVLIYHELGNPLLTTAGLALIGVPIFGDFENEVDGTKYFHYIMAATFFILTAIYLSWWMLVAIGVGTVVGLLTIKKNKLYWLEVIGIIFLITGFYFI